MIMTPPTLKTLVEIAPANSSHIGGKAFNCARLRQAGFPVPDGLVIPADASDDALARARDHPWFDALPADERFAVRRRASARTAPATRSPAFTRRS